MGYRCLGRSFLCKSPEYWFLRNGSSGDSAESVLEAAVPSSLWEVGILWTVHPETRRISAADVPLRWLVHVN